jgi:hypothetical protein
MANAPPIFHLNQLMAIFLGEKASAHQDWRKFHLVDPIPLLKKVGLWENPSQPLKKRPPSEAFFISTRTSRLSLKVWPGLYDVIFYPV